ncbi:MAG: YqaA family protein [Pseudomonadota bacterium]
MMHALYRWTMGLAAHAHARWALFWVAFVESSFFPIPPDVLLLPMVLARRLQAWVYASICTIGSVLGGLAGYAIGYFLYDTVGKRVLEVYGHADKFEQFSSQYNEYGAWIVFIAGVTPFPYKVITIASGVAGLNLLVFLIASVIARGLRFFAVAALLYFFGPPIKAFIEKWLNLLSILFVIVLVGGFIALRYVF